MSTYTITLPLKTTVSDEMHLEQCFYLLWKIHNIIAKEAQKGLRILKRDKEYKSLCAESRRLKEESKKCKDNTKKEELKQKIKDLSPKFQKCYERAGVTQGALEKFAKVQQAKYSKYLSSLQVQKEADRVYEGISDVLYGNGKNVSLKKYVQQDTISQKNAVNGVKYIPDTKSISFNDMVIPLIVDKKDKYAEEALKCRIKYTELKREEFDSGYRYYAILYLEGEPPVKPKNYHGIEETGVDIGVSSVASVSDEHIVLEELAPHSLEYERKIRKLQNKIDRIKRNDNPDNYNEDGTCKKGHHEWKISPKVKRLQRKIRVLYRKQTARIYTEHHNLANRIIRVSSSVTTEKMDWKGLAKRSKKTERQEKISEITDKNGNTKEIHKYKRKKRFGHSVKNRSPGLFQKIIKQKCEQQEIPYREVNTQKFKASQYIHTTGKCIKVPLSQRFKKIAGHNVQRDLYSAFLLKNSHTNLNKPNQAKCKREFQNFIKHHDDLINKMKSDKVSFRQCFGF